MDKPQIQNPNKALENIEQKYFSQLVQKQKSPLIGHIFKRIYPERDIVPEKEDPNCDVLGNGQKVTNAIQEFINRDWLPAELVEETILEELNKIFGSDGTFTHIVCQKGHQGKWEVYLEEELKGRIPLSLSGSGLKTIMIILVFLYLLPKIEKNSLKD